MSIPIEKLRQWGEHRRHFDRTREQEQLGQALLDLIDDREKCVRRAVRLRVAVEAARQFTGRVKTWTGDDPEEAQDLFDLLEQVIADDDAVRGVA